MKKNTLNIISRFSLVHKMLACVIAFFILVSSICISELNTNVSFVESAKVSAGTVMVQFFYISTLPINIVSKIFVNTEAKVPVSKSDTNKGKNSKDENSSKASFGYSIMPNGITFSQVVKVKEIKVFTLLDKVKKSRVFAYFGNYSFVCIENMLKFGFIMMLLLAILLTRRNIGDDNIVIKIKNNKLAQLT